MRFGIIIAAVALAAIATASAGYAQGHQSSSPQRGSQATTANDNFWPNAEQESEIPYRPCQEALGREDGRLVCRNY
jgi:hypothetical protein